MTLRLVLEHTGVNVTFPAQTSLFKDPETGFRRNLPQDTTVRLFLYQWK